MELGLSLSLGGAQGPGLSLATSQYIAAMTSKPSGQRSRLLNDLVNAIAKSGDLTGHDALYLFSSFADQPSRVNMAVPGALTASKTGSPTFAVDKGWTAGTGAYLGSGFNPATAVGPKFTLNDACMWVIVLDQPANSGNAAEIGNANARIISRNSSDVFQTRANDATTSGATASVGFAMYAWSRNNSSDYTRTINGTGAVTQTRASTALTSAEFLIGTINGTAISPSQIGACGFGSSKTPAQLQAIFNAYVNYMASISAETPETSLQVTYASSNVSVISPMLGTNARSIRIPLTRQTNLTNAAAGGLEPFTDAQTWQITKAVAKVAGTYVDVADLARAGETMFAARLRDSVSGPTKAYGTLEFAGGAVHGWNPVTSTPTFYVDGVLTDLSGSGTLTCQTFRQHSVTSLYELGVGGSPSSAPTNTLATVTTDLTWDFAARTLTEDITITGVGTASGLSAPDCCVLQNNYSGMYAGLQGVYTTGYVSPDYVPQDLTDGSPTVFTTAKTLLMVGPDWGVWVDGATGWTLPNRRSTINENISGNDPKIYMDLTGDNYVLQVGQTLTASKVWKIGTAAAVGALIPT